jgi:Pilus formation protein N terminal region
MTFLSEQRWSCLLCAAALAFCLFSPAHAEHAAEVTVRLDQAKLLKLPDKVATIVIGNPLIADVSLQPGGLMVLTGKGYGMTNLLVLDHAGAVLMQKSVLVEGPGGPTVVLYRGIERQTYSCTPICEPRITLGDSNTYFEGAIAQIGNRSGSAQGTLTAQPGTGTGPGTK